MRSATKCLSATQTRVEVSIHALLAECDIRLWPIPGFLRGFNPRTPCGVRLFARKWACPCMTFQSTHSLRSATIRYRTARFFLQVSIHALLAECDRNIPGCRLQSPGFNPRTPCGVRPATGRASATVSTFQSTHSLRSATTPSDSSQIVGSVSIHALLAECDSRRSGIYHSRCSFNPRTPCGVRLGSTITFCEAGQFQSTHSLRSATGQ